MPDEVPPFPSPFPESRHELALDPEVLARELAQELLGDPLDEIEALEEGLATGGGGEAFDLDEAFGFAVAGV